MSASGVTAHHDPALPPGSAVMGRTTLADFPADRCVQEIFRRDDGMQRLTLDDLWTVDLSRTPLAQFPLSAACLGKDGRLTPERVPTVSAYRASSLMDHGEAAMRHLLDSGTYLEIRSPEFSLNTVALNFTDQYLFLINVPGQGHVAEGSASARCIVDDAGRCVYQDVIAHTLYDDIRPVTETRIRIRSEPLPSLTREMQGVPRDADMAQDTALYWFMTDDAVKHFVVPQGQGLFAEVTTGCRYEFQASGPAERPEAASGTVPLVVLDGRRGTMTETLSP